MLRNLHLTTACGGASPQGEAFERKCINEIKAYLDKYLKSKDKKYLNVLDFIGRYKKVSSEGGKVSVVNVNDRVKKIFNLS